jgi:hypothetical protein
MKAKSKLVILSSAGIAVLAAILKSSGQAVPQPGLTISRLSSNQVTIQITNGVSYANYEIYRTPLLSDPAYPFTLHLIGGMGVTNFNASFGIDIMGYFRAGIGSDWDQDGIPNFMDGNVSDTNVGPLRITIDNPTNGSNLVN